MNIIKEITEIQNVLHMGKDELEEGEYQKVYCALSGDWRERKLAIVDTLLERLKETIGGA